MSTTFAHHVATRDKDAVQLRCFGVEESKRLSKVLDVSLVKTYEDIEMLQYLDETGFLGNKTLPLTLLTTS